LADGLDDIHARRLGVNAVKLGVQAVEAATLVDRAPLFELRLGDIDVDRGRPALAADGAVDQARGEPLSDAPLRDVAHLGKF
jgi:hypothetical protein